MRKTYVTINEELKFPAGGKTFGEWNVEAV